eukprot:1732750-Heterocapsa_arctica.AAC.1
MIPSEIFYPEPRFPNQSWLQPTPETGTRPGRTLRGTAGVGHTEGAARGCQRSPFWGQRFGNGLPV